MNSFAIWAWGNSSDLKKIDKFNCLKNKLTCKKKTKETDGKQGNYFWLIYDHTFLPLVYKDGLENVKTNNPIGKDRNTIDVKNTCGP